MPVTEISTKSCISNTFKEVWVCTISYLLWRNVTKCNQMVAVFDCLAHPLLGFLMAYQCLVCRLVAVVAEFCLGW